MTTRRTPVDSGYDAKNRGGPAVSAPILVPTFIALLQEFRPAFTKPSFENFLVLMSGCVHALGGHRLTDALRACGQTPKHYTAYYRLISRARWSLDKVGFVLLRLILRVVKEDVVELVLDDTLCRRTGKKVALASYHADPLLKKQTRGRLFTSYGHVFVVLAVHVRAARLGKTGWALPVLFRLFEGPTRGGQDDSPSDLKREHARRRAGKATRNRVRMTDREVVNGVLERCAPKEDDGPFPEAVRPKKTELGAQLILMVAREFPNRNFRVIADHLYNGRSILHAVLSEVDNVHVISRGRPDAALYELPPARLPGTVGRPRVRGARLPTPAAWAVANPDKFTQRVVTM